MRQQGEDSFLLEGAVDAPLDSLLEDHRGPVRSKVIRELLDLLAIQVGSNVCLLVDVDAHWEEGQKDEGADQQVFNHIRKPTLMQ